MTFTAQAAALPARAATTYTYVTDFTKNNNIYTNLNEQFPNTGPGVPGSEVGTANASFLFNPATYTSANYVAGSDLATNGVNFELTSDAAGQDFEQIDTGTSLTLNPNVANATNVYLLTGAYSGTFNGGVTYNVTFTGSSGVTQAFNGVLIPDFNGYEPVNSSGMGLLDQTVLQVHDVGAGGTGNSTTGAFNTYDLNEQSFTLDPSFAGQTLASVQITSNGYEPLLLGVTVASDSPATSAAVPEASSFALLTLGLLPVGRMVRRRNMVPQPHPDRTLNRGGTGRTQAARLSVRGAGRLDMSLPFPCTE